MKYLAWITLILFGCETTAKPFSKPSGEQALASLFEVSDRVLSKEPLCNTESFSAPRSPYTLGHHLSVILSTSYETNNLTRIQTSCSASKHEASDGKLIDIWDCRLTTNETSESGGFVSASTIAFGLDKSNFKFVQESLRCF